MQAAREELDRSSNLARLNQIMEGEHWYRFIQKLLKQAGKTEGQRRHLTGKVYRFETDGRSVSIQRQGQIIFQASDERIQGGIIQTQKMAMTEQDQKIVQQAVEMIQARLKHQQRQSQSRGMSL